MYHTVNIKLYFDYPKRKDGFTGRENRRYWIINTKTNKKIRITEKIFDGIQASKIL
jgi:hypothetical protein